MPTDNVTLSPGTGGATIRTFADSNGDEWPANVLAYVTTLSPGANVLTPVSQAAPLPVEASLTGSIVVSSITGDTSVVSDTAANFLVTASLAAGQTLGAVTSVGTVGAITGNVSVVQSTAGNLLCTASQGGSWTVAATQSGTWNVGTVSSITSVTNPVTVAQSTAGNLLCTASQGGSWTVAATQSGTWNIGAVSSPVTVAQSTASNLNATVNQGGSWSVAATQSGTWNVGTITSVTNPVAATQSGTWNAGISAGSNLIGKTSAGSDTSTIYSGTTALTPKFAKISASSSGDNQIVAAVTGKKIRVLRWGLTAAGTVGVKWRSNTTDLTGVRPLIQYASAGGSYSPIGIFETAAGEALNLNLSAAIAVGGEVAYIEV